MKNDQQIQAFNGMQRWYHKHIIHFMFFLIITGLPVFSHSFSWLGYLYAVPYDFFTGSNTIILADGINTARMLHRVIALMFVLASIPFVLVMLKDIKKWQIWPEDKWTIGALISGIKEVIFTYTTFKHGQIGKYNVAQKLMAWAIIGCTVGITISGVALMFRGQFTLDAQEWLRTIHAVCFVLLCIMMVAHIYFAVFPINRDGLRSMFGDGKLPLEHIKHHHPLWYKKLTGKKNK